MLMFALANRRFSSLRGYC